MKSSFVLHIPRYNLSRHVQFIWMSRGENDQTKSRVLPNGVIELILNFGNIQKTLHDGSFSDKSSFKNYWVAGLQKGPLIIQSLTDTNLLGIRFRPGGAYPFFRFPVTELSDKVIEADWLHRELEELREQLYETGNTGKAFELVEQYLLRKITGWEENKAVGYIVRHLEQEGAEAVRISDLIGATGYSHKHLISVFKQQVGISPKALQRIIRFQRVIQGAKGVNKVKWTDLLYDLSFYDPAHFVKDFRELSGITPDQYLVNRTFDENHCIIR